MTVVAELFDRVLTLEEGETIILTFDSHKELMSKKVMLFREKYKYEKALKNAPQFKTFFISQECNQKTGVFKLKLSTNGTSLDWLTSAVIKQKGGEVKALDIEVIDKNAERIKNLQEMK